MNLYCLKFTNNNMKTKHKRDEEINPYSHCTDCGLNYWQRRTRWLPEKFKLYIKQCYWIVWNLEKIQKAKTLSKPYIRFF